MALSPAEMRRAVIANLPEKTGKSLQQWLAILKKGGPDDAKEQVQWLKSAHKLGHVTAQCIVASAAGRGDEYAGPAKLIDALLAGNPVFKKIYIKIEKIIKTLPGAQAKPCKTYVPFYHRLQFARVKPGGRSHLELYLALGSKKLTKGRLVPVKPSAARMTHVLQLNVPDEVDDKVRAWLKQAYDAAA